MKNYITLLLLITTCNLSDASDYIKLKTILHVHTNVSYTGKYDFYTIANNAYKKNLDVVVFTDHDFMRWEYGVFPLRSILKKVVNYPSIYTYGFNKYIATIREVNREFPDMVLIPGIECAPYYYWEGGILTGLTLRNWHKHFLVFGLDAKEMKNIPVQSNPNTKDKFYFGFSIILLWPVLLVLPGVFIVFNYVFLKIKSRKEHLIVPFKFSMSAGVVLILFGVIFLVNNYPFSENKGPYYKNTNLYFYQRVINYVNSRNGLIFYAHPEEGWVEQFGNIKTVTYNNPSDLYLTYDYTGFAAFWSGRNIIKIGGIWDKLLMEYCNGERKKPVWAIAELDYDGKQNSSVEIDSQWVVLMVKVKSEIGCLNALRKGRFYIERKGWSFTLNEFTVTGINIGISGERVIFNKSIKLRFEIQALYKKTSKNTINIIRNGDVIKTFNVFSSKTIEFIDIPSFDCGYYRVEVWQEGDIIFLSNPIFILRYND